MNITRNCGIEKITHEKCHHDMIYRTFNVPLPPLCYREIWDHKHANVDNLQKSISMFDWHKALKNKNTNEMPKILTDTFMNIFKNFIPRKTKKFDCKYSEWMDSFIISSLQKKNEVH